MEFDEYKTIIRQSEGGYSELRSKFIALAYPVEKVDEAMNIIAEAKRKYYDARHVTYAYMIGTEERQFRANDDGEPSSTAGKPILGQIRSNELTNILLIVVRYFGGVKLGTSKLAEAYRIAASDAISNNEVVLRCIMYEITIHYDYEHMNSVMHVLKDCEARILENTYDNGCKIRAAIRKSKFEGVKERLLKVETLIVNE